MNSVVKKVIFIIPLVIGIVGIAAAGFFFWQYQQAQKILNSPSVVAQKEAQDLIVSIGKLMELPQNEQPTVATVSDADKLKNSSFFQGAKNGDKVLIYPSAKKAILYDPRTNKIIDVAPVNIGNTTASPTSVPKSASATQTSISVVLYNGTTQTGVTSIVEKKITNDFPNVNVVSRSKASKTDYKGTLVIDLSGTQSDLTTAIATSVKGQVGKLPDGETKPSAGDILIIVGG